MSDITRDTLQWAVDHAAPNQVVLHDHVFVDRKVSPLLPPLPETLVVNTLQGLADYVNAKVDGREDIFVHVESPISVKLYGKLENSQRECLVHSKWQAKPFEFGRWFEPGDFIVELRTKFERNDDLAVLLKLSGNVRQEAVKTNVDDGVGQIVTVRRGAAFVDQAPVPLESRLLPYRTFMEVGQPSSSFIVRVQEGGPHFTLFESDGGMWKIHAVKNIKDWLTGELPKETVILS